MKIREVVGMGTMLLVGFTVFAMMMQLIHIFGTGHYLVRLKDPRAAQAATISDALSLFF